MSKLKTIAMIPARGGSVRLPGKNVRVLHGHPLLAYSITAAIQSKLFDMVMVSTDNAYYAEIAKHYGAEVPHLRPLQFATSTSPDIEWIEYTLSTLAKAGRVFDCFSILRPTSPFRSADTIRRAWNLFSNDPEADSLRAVEKCSQHPGKMWIIDQNRMQPLMPKNIDGVPWHSCQMASLPEIYVQNASLEIAWTRVVEQYRTIAGNNVIPFITEGAEGFDINMPDDWWLAKHMIASGQAQLPEISTATISNVSDAMFTE